MNTINHPGSSKMKPSKGRRGSSPGLKGALRATYDDLKIRIWFYPSLLTSASVVAAVALIRLDRAYSWEIASRAPWLFGGTADAAWSLLSAIATSLITVVSIAFSITIIALQQASNQYSPRVLRTFTSDKGNQIVLGMYLATFVFSLLVLRTVRSGEDGFVPAISVNFAIFFTLVCLGLLIYFIHRIATSLQGVNIIRRIHGLLLQQIDVMYPETVGVGSTDPRPAGELIAEIRASASTYCVRAENAGFLNRVDEKTLARVRDESVRWIYVPIEVGDFVAGGAVIAEMDRMPSDEGTEAKIKKALVIKNERSFEDDPMYGIRQLVDIALRALSPGINDPTTAEYCLLHIGDALGFLASRRFPENRREFPGNPVKFILNSPGWDDYIRFSLDQIRGAINDKPRIIAVVLHVIDHIAENAVSWERARILKEELEELRLMSEKGDFSRGDKDKLLASISHVEKKLA